MQRATITLNSLNAAFAHLGLTKDLEQFVVGQEVEATEAGSLRLQVVTQALMHHIKHLRALTELLQELSVVAKLDASGAEIGT